MLYPYILKLNNNTWCYFRNPRYIYLTVILFLFFQQPHHNPHLLFCSKIQASSFNATNKLSNLAATMYFFMSTIHLVSLLPLLYPLIPSLRPDSTFVTNRNCVPKVYIYSYDFRIPHVKETIHSQKKHSGYEKFDVQT